MLQAGYVGLAADADAGEQGVIDLLLTDVMMPEGTGKDLHDEILLRFGPIPTIFVSGYAPAAIARHAQLDPDLTLLTKPWRTPQLLQLVRRMIDDRVPTG